MPAVKLINVRLDAGDASKARFLRGEGVEISRIVRNAIREEYERRHVKKRRRTAKQILEAIYAAHPEPADAPPPVANIHDRRAFRDAVARRLRNKKFR